MSAATERMRALEQHVNKLAKRVETLESEGADLGAGHYAPGTVQVRSWHPGCGSYYSNLYALGTQWWYAEDIKRALRKIVNEMPEGVSCSSLVRLINGEMP